MRSKKPAGLFVAMLAFALVFQACAQPTEVPPTSTPVPPTATKKPTSTPRPSATPNLEATRQYEEIFSKVQEYKDQGYISDTRGSYVELQDFNEEWAQRGWYQWWTLSFDINFESFVLEAHFSWASAGDTSDNSGCGIVFALQEDGKNYSVFLDKSRIYFTRSDSHYYYELGKTKGTGRVQFGNPAEADFSLVVSKPFAYVLVDGEFIGQYSLSADQPLKGTIAYSLLSGTNKDYGTRCEITNSRLWVLNP